MSRSFRELREGNEKRRGFCSRCQKEKTQGRVQLGIQAYDPLKRRPYKQVATRSISLCEQCCIEVYEATLVKLLGEVAGGFDS